MLASGSAAYNVKREDIAREGDQAARGANKENSTLPAAGKPQVTTGVAALPLCAETKKAISCQLCQGLLASSLVLQCSHTFCGACLFDHLNSRPSCPTCNVGLRAIPVRCLALDSVVSSFSKLVPRAEQEAFAKRVEDGKSAANKLNKMFWWLQPSVPVAAGGGDNNPTGHGSSQSGLPPQHNTMPPATTNLRNRSRSASYGGGAPLPPAPPQLAPFAAPSYNSFSAGVPPVNMRFGGLPHPGLGGLAQQLPMQNLMGPSLSDSAALFADYDQFGLASAQAMQAQAQLLQQAQAQMHAQALLQQLYLGN